MCRKHRGTLFGSLVGVEPAKFRWLEGTEHIVPYRYSQFFGRPFCRICGTSLPDADAPTVLCPAGLLPDLEPLPSARTHIFVDSKSPMHEITDQLRQFSQYPPGYGYGSTSDAPAVALPEDGRVHGSCLCGTIAFAIGAAPQRMVNCYCSRCRLSRAGVHATNAFTPLDNLEWMRGQQHIKTYRVPDAALFATSFCELCGSLMPAPFTKLGRYLVPAGSLDSPLPIKPGAHIYVDSKLPWFQISDTLPQFAQMPPRERIAEVLFGA
jgi:hypothetical protein